MYFNQSILYKEDPEPDPDLQKKRNPDIYKKLTLYNNLLYELKIYFWQILGCWFQIWQYFFKIPAQKYQNKTFLVPNLRMIVFSQILQLDKFECADFKYANSIFKILAQKYPNKAFLVKNTQIGIFVFPENFVIGQIQGCWF